MGAQDAVFWAWVWCIVATGAAFVAATVGAARATKKSGGNGDDSSVVVGNMAARLTLRDEDPQPADPDEVQEFTYWKDELHKRRQNYLADIRAAATSWRTVFTTLLGLFATVIALAGTDVLKPATGATAAPLVPIMVTLILTLNAVAYTGWASTGMPRQFTALRSGEALRDAEWNHAARSRVRLRVGLVCGGLSLATATLTVGAVLAKNLP